MTGLSEQQRQRAVNYLKHGARPLEQQLYAYHFEGGSAEAVLAELAKFQNADGGFGHGLESDLRLADSSAIATTIAFQKFREVNAPSSEAMVQHAANYLLETYDPTGKIWQIIPPNIDDAPHAPWWSYDGNPARFLVNPRVEILAYFYAYPDLFPFDLREELTQEVLDHLADETDEIEMHDLLCYIRLLETPGIPPTLETRLLEKLQPAVMKAVAQNPSDWGTYGLTPLSVVSSPESLFYDDFAALIPENLTYLAGFQTDDGYWSPPWSWESVSPEGWRKAEKDIRGVLTLSNLITFRNFGE
jgi:hypothetical protein